MPGNYSKLVTVITGQSITAAERNNEFDNVINNMTPDGVDDASANLAAMQATVDPSGGSLATDLRGELKRLRFQLLKLGVASGNWYDALAFLAGITPVAAGATATDLNNRLAQLASQMKNLGGLTNWYDAITAALLKAGGTMTGPLAMGGQLITGLPAGTLAGHALRFEQLFGGDVTLIGNLIFNPTTKGIKGTTTNDNAAAGNVGEYVESVITSAVAAAATTQWKDMTSIALTAGDWDVSFSATYQWLANAISMGFMGVSQTSGNSATGLVYGSNYLEIPLPTAVLDTHQHVVGYRVLLSAPATVYAKINATYTTTAPQFLGRLSARRKR